jgi:hypothetical protein
LVLSSPDIAKAQYYRTITGVGTDATGAVMAGSTLACSMSDLDAKFNLGLVCLQQPRQADAEKLLQEVTSSNR